MEFSVSIPLDADGYLRRECPTCNRQFKWFNGRTEDTPADWVDPDEFFCPYCAAPAATSAWFTEEQASYVGQVMAGHAGDYLRGELEDLARGINRQGGLIKMTVSEDGDSTLPPPLSEPNDMIAVAPPCHPFEPLKVLEGWSDPLHCLVCGAAFMVD
jgi:hypothetical protein